jgi:hypothetical protein
MFGKTKTTRTQLNDLPETFANVADEHLEEVTGGLIARGVAGGVTNTRLMAGSTYGPNSCTQCNDTDCGPD